MPIAGAYYLMLSNPNDVEVILTFFAFFLWTPKGIE